jgi:hypothetical protein
MATLRIALGRVAEWFKAPVLKTGRGFCSLVSSNLTPSAKDRQNAASDTDERWLVLLKMSALTRNQILSEMGDDLREHAAQLSGILAVIPIIIRRISEDKPDDHNKKQVPHLDLLLLKPSTGIACEVEA